MLDRLARVVAKHTSKPTGRSGGPDQPTPKGPGIFPPVPAAMVSAVPMGTTLVHRLDPDENLSRQNVSI
jgi:hypothetical protein